MPGGETPLAHDELVHLVDSLEDACVALETTEPAHPRLDLKPLAQTIADVDVVGLGEHSHGTREVFQFKDRLFRFLVEELDYRILAFEVPYCAGIAINEFITSREGAVEEVLCRADVHSIWRCEAIAEMLDWMRDWNAERAPDDKIQFYGVDLHWGKPTYLESYLERVDPAFLEELREDLDYLEAHSVGGDLAIEDSVAFAEAQQRIADMAGERMKSRRPSYIAASSQRAYELAEREVHILSESGEHWKKVGEEDPQSNAFRSIVMAKNVEWVLEFEEREDAAIWAHNTHVQRELLLDEEFDYETVMGRYLAEADGIKYYSLGFEVGEETVRVVSVDDGGFEHLRRAEIPEREIATVLTQLDADELFIDVRTLPQNDVVKRWLDLPPKRVFIGGRGELLYAETNLVEEHDGLVYIDRGNPARGIERSD